MPTCYFLHGGCQLISLFFTLGSFSHLLRFSSQSLLHVPRIKTDFGRRDFSSAAPQIWNHIPTTIRGSPSLDSFKCHLKTHYTLSRHNTQHYGDSRHLWFNFLTFGALPNFYIRPTLHRTVVRTSQWLSSVGRAALQLCTLPTQPKNRKRLLEIIIPLQNLNHPITKLPTPTNSAG